MTYQPGVSWSGNDLVAHLWPDPSLVDLFHRMPEKKSHAHAEEDEDHADDRREELDFNRRQYTTQSPYDQLAEKTCQKDPEDVHEMSRSSNSAVLPLIVVE